MDENVRKVLQRGTVIPAHPLALNKDRKLDERRQRALSRYYIATGAGGLAIGVHTTQFAIRDPKVGLFEPVLAIAKEEMDRADASRTEPLLRVGGIIGTTGQATREAMLLRDMGYHAGLLSLSAFPEADDATMLTHCQKVAEIIPLFGFYLQPAVGGRILSYDFWRGFLEIPNVVAIKIAPFNRYQTLDVVRAAVDAGREDVALYTGNDDTIVLDLLTPFRFNAGGRTVERRIVGGLLGHWAVWTRRAVELLERCHAIAHPSAPDTTTAVPQDLLALHNQTVDANAALFDAANGFKGCIAGLHEVLRRQGLFEGVWCLDPEEGLSPGQQAEINRIYAAYPHLTDDDFVAEHLHTWLGEA